MKRNAKRRNRQAFNPLTGGALAATAGLVARNPLTVGGGTAFLVTLSFVSANALWYQPHAQHHVFFSTRHVAMIGHSPRHSGKHALADRTAKTASSGIAASPAASPAAPVKQSAGVTPDDGARAPDLVKKVQAALHHAGLYDGPIDGVDGPITRKAISAYQARASLADTGEIDDALMRGLKIPPRHLPQMVTAAPAPRPEIDASSTQSIPVESQKARMMRIQAGLKAFGNDGIRLDGVIGADTTAAIREFQTLFGLQVTGKPDDRLYAKMREVGLID